MGQTSDKFELNTFMTYRVEFIAIFYKQVGDIN